MTGVQTCALPISVGGWKKEPNSTVGVVDGRQVIFDYAPPDDVPLLMADWFRLFDELCRGVTPGDRQKALFAYVCLHATFARIHPFFDGNGRLARLVGNIPVLKAGLPPIIIPSEERKAYIEALSAYHHAAGRIRAGHMLLPDTGNPEIFTDSCQMACHASIELLRVAS